MRLDKVVKSILKSVVYMMDEAADRVDRVSDRASDFADNARRVIYPNEGNTTRHLMSFPVALGVGTAAGVLPPPPSGEKLRQKIGKKVKNISGKSRGGGDTSPTGTDLS